MSKTGKTLAGVLGGPLGYGIASGKVGLGDLAKYGAFGLAGMAARKALRKKKKKNPGEPDDEMVEGAKPTMRKGGKVKKMAKGGKVNCRRGDGICRQGRTRGKMR